MGLATASWIAAWRLNCWPAMNSAFEVDVRKAATVDCLASTNRCVADPNISAAVCSAR